MIAPTTTWTLSLGSGDCETCGPHWDTLTVGHEAVDGEIEIQLSVGCYGGDGTMTSDLDEALATLERIGREWEHLIPAEDLQALRRGLVAVVMLWRSP